jgi:hypothetical protein
MPDLGKIAYEAYCKFSGGKSLVSGEQLPTWDNQDSKIRDAWRAAAQAVMEC